MAIVLEIGFVLFLSLGFSAIMAFPFMWLVNVVSPALGGPTISYWPAFCGLLLLSWIGGILRRKGD